MKADYIIRAGESLMLSLLLVEGDEIITEVTAVLKKAGPNGTVPPLSAPSVVAFTVTDTTPPDIGWDLSLTDEQTAIIPPGMYITNAKLDIEDGSVYKTEPILIEVRGSVS